MKHLNNLITEVLREWADSDTPVSQEQGGWGKAPGSPFAGRGVSSGGGAGVLSNESQAALDKWKKCVALCIQKLGPKYNTWPPKAIQLCQKYGNDVETAMGQPQPPNQNNPANTDAMGVGAPNNSSATAFAGPF